MATLIREASMRGWIVIAALASVAACETGPPMSPAQCQVADWAQVGFQDGAQGRPAERFVALEQACAAAGIPSNSAAYMAGRRDGLLDYCQPDRAFRLGLGGGGYNGVCPPELDYHFRNALSDGARAHDALSALRSAESAINAARSERDDIERKIDANELGLQRSETDEERNRHRDELNRLRAERARVNDRLREAERDERDGARDVRRVRSELGFRYGDW
jgi:Protein of unknown function (DUF2799)